MTVPTSGDGHQALPVHVVDEVQYIASAGLGVDRELALQGRADLRDRGTLRQEVPHSRADGPQNVIRAGGRVEHHRLAVDLRDEWLVQPDERCFLIDHGSHSYTVRAWGRWLARLRREARIAAVSAPRPAPLRAPGLIHEIEGDLVRVDLPGVARVAVRGGEVQEILVHPQADAADVAWFRGGHVRQLAALQRGTFALRASAVVLDGVAVAICSLGPGGSSAVAAGLARRGHAVIADGWLPVGVPGLKAEAITNELALWPDVARLAGRDPEGGRAVRPALLKRRHQFLAGASARLGAIFVLRPLEPDDDTGDARGGSALELVLDSTSLQSFVAALNRASEHFAWAVALADGCPVVRLELDRHRPGIEEPARAVEAMVRA
jgi:hypothetical protein